MHLMICTVAREVTELSFAQMQNVFHPGIKTPNINYEPASDTVKITDFGIACITNSRKTETGMVLGTPPYRSPERLAGKPADARTGLFSLAAVLYRVFSGSLRFKADSMASLMFKIGNEAADIPGALATVISKALPKNVEQRFQGNADYASAVKVFLKPRS